MARTIKLMFFSGLVLFVQAFFVDISAQTLPGAVRCVSSNTVVLDANVREKVTEESAPLAFFSSEKVGLSFVIR